MNIDGASSILSAYQTLTTQGYTTDSSKLAAKLTSRLLEARDTDGDGYLTNSDLSELSDDEFSQLDSDGDSQLSSDEINSAFIDQMDAIKLATQSGTTGSGTLSILRNTAAGKLMQAMKTTAASSTTASSSTTSSTTTGTSSILDITA